MDTISDKIDNQVNNKTVSKQAESSITYNVSSELNGLFTKEYEDFIEIVKQNFVKYNEKLIKKAFLLNINVNKERVLRSGNLSYSLNINIAKYLSQSIKLDDISIVSALLMDTINKTPIIDIKYIKNEFGEVVAEIVEGISKIRFIETNSLNKDENYENYRYILLSLFKDIRIILIKLIDRVFLLRDLDFFSPAEQVKFASETLEIYVPFANRFGLTKMKSELEDLSFKFKNPIEYAELVEKIFGTQDLREKYIQDFIKPIQEGINRDEVLSRNNIKCNVYGRAKHIYSIANKLINRKVPLEQLNDIVAMRIILDTDEPNFCYFVFGIVCQHYKLVSPETFKDYIANPKPNGYQSLHSAFLGPQNKSVEIQIRTQKMHENAENGIAAHFQYKSGLVGAESVLNNSAALNWMQTVRDLLENTNSDEQKILMDSFNTNKFIEDLHVFSPKNEILKFSKGATALDFAYHIHSELGYYCAAVKVNNKLVPLNYKLQSGDQVEVITSKNPNVELSTLNLVATHKAKSLILKYLRNKDKKQISEGEKLWKKELEKRKIKISKDNFLNLLQNIGFNDEPNFYRDMFLNKIDKNMIFNSILFGAQEHIIRKNINRPKKKNENTQEISFTKIKIGTLYTLTLEGKMTDDVLNEATNIITNFDELILQSVDYSNLEDTFICKYEVQFDSEVDFSTIYKQIAALPQIQKVTIV